MRRQVVAGVAVLASVMAACGSGGASTASRSGGSSATSAAADKTAFCADNVKIDMAFANVQSPADALNALKANQSLINDLGNHLPPGSLGNEARQVLSTAKDAIAKNDAGVLNNPQFSQYGADLDTYCGVDGNGNPLPSYFAHGKGSAFCTAEVSLANGVSGAADAAGALAYLKAHQGDVDSFAAGVPGLPSPVQANAQTVLTTTRAAITSNDASALQSQSFDTAALSVDEYCGINH